jgi:hypothetical protein
LLFARYAYPPNSLGLCGADRPRELLEYGAANSSDLGLAGLARTFEGAWPYLTLIAGCNGIPDPLDERVVEAYWVGNELLDRVSPNDLVKHIDDRFHNRIGRAQEHLNDTIAAGAVPHHCFHVFAVYPWLGLLRTGIVDQPLHILDQCRVTPAVVQSVGCDGTLTVTARPLLWSHNCLMLGAPSPRTVRWETDGMAFIARPVPGDDVSLHWDFVCDQLAPNAARALLAANQRAITSVNRGGAAAGLS